MSKSQLSLLNLRHWICRSRESRSRSTR